MRLSLRKSLGVKLHRLLRISTYHTFSYLKGQQYISIQIKNTLMVRFSYIYLYNVAKLLQLAANSCHQATCNTFSVSETIVLLVFSLHMQYIYI